LNISRGLSIVVGAVFSLNFAGFKYLCLGVGLR